MKKTGAKNNADAAIPLPEPIELAKVAANLCPNGKPEAAMKRAMEFYIEASLFVTKLPKSFDALMAYASEERKREDYIMQPLRRKLEKARADTLRLDPQADSDPARVFLAANGFRGKTARAVLENFRRMLGDAAEQELTRYTRSENGRIVYDFPRFRLQQIVVQQKTRGAESQRKSWRTRKSRKK